MVLPEIQNIIGNLYLDQNGIIRVRPQLSKASVTLGKNRIHDLTCRKGAISLQAFLKV